MVVNTPRPGELVVCNLASLSLGNIPVEDDAYLQKLVASVVRALDNVCLLYTSFARYDEFAFPA